ncbi:hypothetical protein PR048_033777, partial [Dryococelus australis]
MLSHYSRFPAHFLGGEGGEIPKTRDRSIALLKNSKKGKPMTGLGIEPFPFCGGARQNPGPHSPKRGWERGPFEFALAGAAHLELVYLGFAFGPSLTACFGPNPRQQKSYSSPGALCCWGCASSNDSGANERWGKKKPRGDSTVRAPSQCFSVCDLVAGPHGRAPYKTKRSGLVPHFPLAGFSAVDVALYTQTRQKGFKRKREILKGKAQNRAKPCRTAFFPWGGKPRGAGERGNKSQTVGQVPRYIWLCMETWQLNPRGNGGECAPRKKKTRIIPRHLHFSIRNDLGLNKLLGGVTIARAVSPPKIQPCFPPKKMRRKPKALPAFGVCDSNKRGLQKGQQ